MSGEGRTEQGERVVVDILERTEPGLDAREHGLYAREAKRNPGGGVLVVVVPDRIIVLALVSLLIGSIGVRVGVGAGDALCFDVERLGRVCRILSGLGAGSTWSARNAGSGGSPGSSVGAKKSTSPRMTLARASGLNALFYHGRRRSPRRGRAFAANRSAPGAPKTKV
jgi:hypothetical protein